MSVVTRFLSRITGVQDNSTDNGAVCSTGDCATPATTQQSRTGARAPARTQQQNPGAEVGRALRSSVNKTLGAVGSYAIPPIIIGLIVTILLFICTWIIAQAISQLFGIHRQFLVISLAFLIGAILAGTARLVWGMSGVAVGIGNALKSLLVSAEAHNWDRQMVMGRLFLIGSITGLFVLITLFTISILGGVGFYVTSQTTSNNIFAFNSDQMLQTSGAEVSQADLESRAIGILPQMEAGRMLAGINSAGISRPAASIAAPVTGVTNANTGKKTHKVRRGDTLNAIATRYGVTVAAIKQVNRMSGNQINIGQTITIP